MHRRVACLVLCCALLPAAPGWARKGAKRRSKSPPIATLTKGGWPNVQAAAAVVVDLDTGEELYTKDPDAVRPIASVGKLLVALTVRRKGLPLDGKTTISEEDRSYASGGAKPLLLLGREFTNHDILRAMLIASDNRAVTAVGRGAGLTPTELVAAVNEEAKRLGLGKTSFTDPTGLNGNVSTPREIAVVLRAAMADPVLAEIMQTPWAVITSTDEKHVSVNLWNTNRALHGRHEVVAGKTGYTDEARYCLAIAVKVGDRHIGMVFLGAEGKLTRYGDTSRVLDWIDGGGLEKAKGARAEIVEAGTAGVGAAADPPPAPMTPHLAK